MTGLGHAARLLLAAWLTACGANSMPRAAASTTATLHVVGTDERTHLVGDLVAQHAWTVLVFFSDTCPTVTAHDQRLIALWRSYHPRDVAFYMVASSSQLGVVDLQREAGTRGYPFPLVWDRGGNLAHALGVRYASQAFVLSRDGNVAYEGSIDSDRRFLHADATPYLRDALDALLQGSTPRTADTAAYGCALELQSP